ncbi:MAG: STAS domain-containing protein, partial [Herpetosiphonaceae bacterium]|nr:STAS domain-containing protein [Herpetosiphonaceae bacterium]
SVPVLPLDRGLLVIPVIGTLDRERLDDLRRQALGGIETYAAEQVLLDITGVPMLDRAVAESLLGTIQAARLLGAEVTLVGVRPEVAEALVSLNIDTRAFQSYSSLLMALESTRSAEVRG